MTYGAEAVIPLKIGLVFDRVKGYSREANHGKLWASLDLLQEAQEKARIRVVTYK